MFKQHAQSLYSGCICLSPLLPPARAQYDTDGIPSVESLETCIRPTKRPRPAAGAFVHSPFTVDSSHPSQFWPVLFGLAPGYRVSTLLPSDLTLATETSKPTCLSPFPHLLEYHHAFALLQYSFPLSFYLFDTFLVRSDIPLPLDSLVHISLHHIVPYSLPVPNSS